MQCNTDGLLLWKFMQGAIYKKCTEFSYFQINNTLMEGKILKRFVSMRKQEQSLHILSVERLDNIGACSDRGP